MDLLHADGISQGKRRGLALRLRTLLAILVLLPILWLALSKLTNAMPVLPIAEYRVYLGASADQFDDDSIVVAGGPDVGGTAVLFINGDPVLLHRTGGRVAAINAWLHRGENTIAVAGTFERPVYLKVGEFRENALLRVVAKQVFRAGDDGNEISRFNLDLPYVLPPRESLSEDKAQRVRYSEEIHSALDRLKSAMAAHDGAAVAKMSELALTVRAKAFSKQPAEIAASADASRRQFSDQELRLDDKQGGPIEIVFGKRSVLVYCDEAMAADEAAFSIIMRRGQERVTVPPLRLVRAKGGWVPWE